MGRMREDMAVASILALLAVLAILPAALVQANRAWRAGRIDWRKTVVTTLGVLVVTALAIGALILGVRCEQDELGLVGFIAMLGGGLTVVIVAVNRRWPAR